MSYKKRQKYIVQPKFQFKFALAFIIAALIGSISSTALFNYFAMIKLEQLQWSVHISTQSTGEVLKLIFIYINLFSLVFVSILFGITGFRMLKKINGPVYRLIKCLELIKNGDLSKPVVLRQKDEFTNVAKSLDDMREQIRRRFIESKKQYENISQAAKAIEKELINGKKVEKKVEKATFMIEQLKKGNQNH
ncbi:MAG: methyl-accepting chemotaxis protein [Deltaproteobacteria bacterium]|nr:methyl-accepting chemotaxis protein [Deltaproteobacteria bacterium]